MIQLHNGKIIKSLNDVQVFSDEWFEIHQTKLLFFANNCLTKKLFRKALGISFHEELTDITPTSTCRVISPQNNVHQLTAYQDAVYANFFRENLYGLWASLHAIDSLFLDRVFKNLTFGFYTFPEPSYNNPYIANGIYRDDGNHSWADIIVNGAGTFAGSNLRHMRVISSATTDMWLRNEHGRVRFNTSVLHRLGINTAYSGRMYLYCTAKSNGLGGSFVLSVYQETGTDLGSAQNDYASRNSTKLTNDIAYSDIVVGGYNIFTLNSSGLSALDFSSSGRANYMLLDSAYDVAGTQPTWSASQTSDVVYSSATGQRPTLEIEYAGNSMGTARNPRIRPAAFSPGHGR